MFSILLRVFEQASVTLTKIQLCCIHIANTMPTKCVYCSVCIVLYVLNVAACAEAFFPSYARLYFPWDICFQHFCYFVHKCYLGQVDYICGLHDQNMLSPQAEFIPPKLNRLLTVCYCERFFFLEHSRCRHTVN